LTVIIKKKNYNKEESRKNKSVDGIYCYKLLKQ